MLTLLFAMVLGASHAPADVDAARASYRGVGSVHLEADVTITKTTVGGVVTGKGTFGYWADGDKYLVTCSTDPALGLVDDLQYAFDGVQAQVLHGQTLVVNSGEDTNVLFTPVPNPFFLPVDYLNPRSDDCTKCSLKLSDIQRGEPPVHVTRKFMGDELTLVTRDGEIRWDRAGGGKGIVIRFDGSLHKGWPRRMSWQYFDEKGREVLRFEHTIRVFETNVSLAPSTFQIPLDSAQAVFDERDGRAILRPRP